jgi:hypothetical protein
VELGKQAQRTEAEPRRAQWTVAAEVERQQVRWIAAVRQVVAEVVTALGVAVSPTPVQGAPVLLAEVVVVASVAAQLGRAVREAPPASEEAAVGQAAVADRVADVADRNQRWR